MLSSVVLDGVYGDARDEMYAKDKGCRFHGFYTCSRGIA